MFDEARGQFGVSLWDRNRRTLLLGRDRVGISPFFHAEVDGWLLWASEIKSLLASGMIDARPDVRGIDYFFNFFSLPNRRTIFEGVHMLPPGHYARVHEGRMTVHRYWDLDFPDAGAERRFDDPQKGADELESLLRGPSGGDWSARFRSVAILAADSIRLLSWGSALRNAARRFRRLQSDWTIPVQRTRAIRPPSRLRLSARN